MGFTVMVDNYKTTKFSLIPEFQSFFISLWIYDTRFETGLPRV